MTGLSPDDNVDIGRLCVGELIIDYDRRRVVRLGEAQVNMARCGMLERIP